MAISWDRLASQARRAAATAGKVAGEVVDTSKTKLSEVRLNSEIRDAYERLGALTYDASRLGRSNEQLREMVMSEIDGLLKERELLKTQTAAMNGMVLCPQCGAANSMEVNFCNKCGSPLRSSSHQASESPAVEVPLEVEKEAEQ
ncbi:zinc ribbon domain-containing protein [Angelakisella massiliensis]|uniref:zinc ribbon domain-containing protein n=1 Tax=Angelakisella massiliensis TaxID=1871018 RepID=UPI0008F95C1C|nr:zinc ribbon domain-containing protein [Angelakisella massiliensis]